MSTQDGPVLVDTGIPDLLPMVRSEGQHISPILRKLCVALGHFEDSEEGPDQTRLEFGNAFEDAIAERYARAYPGRFIRIGELFYGGLYGTPDLFDLEEWAIVEIKLTWMSSNAHPDSKKFWKYWTQAKTYCKMAESVGCGTTKVRLIVGHIMGDYDRSKLPQPVVNHWQQTFSQSEINDTWQMIQSHR